jgi:NAD(P)-dependent dehydrogenase (short-subunit alcohol dehydrogenase family)
MKLGIEGKRAVVLGASKGMGRAVALALAENGVRVAAVARSNDALRSMSVSDYYAADLTRDSDLFDTITWIKDSFGSPDILVHVMGGSAGIRDHLLPSSEWVKVWRLNLGIAQDINREFIPAMAARGWGRVVHFSSNGVKLGTGNVPYISAKGAVESYVKNLSRMYSPQGVVITAVSPGPIYTPGLFMYSQNQEWTDAFYEKYVPMKRWGRASEVGGAVAFLCSEHASYMAGAIVPIDGGMR